MILQIIEDALFSAIAAIGFASLSNPPRRACLASGLIAAVGHSVRFVLMKFTALDLHVVVATAIASLIIGVLAVVVSSRTKVPAEACLYPSLLPMFPGIYAYRTFGALVMCLYKGSEGAFNHYFYLFASNGFTCFFILLAMVAGATIPLFAMNRISFQVTRRGHTPVL